MAISDNDAREANLQTLIGRALQEAGIEKSGEEQFDSAGVATCWRQAGGEVELVVSRLSLSSSFHGSIGLRYFAQRVLGFKECIEDADVIKLSNIIKRIQVTLAELPQSVADDLKVGALNRINFKSLEGTLPGELVDKLKELEPLPLKAGKSPDWKLRKTLRGEQGQGGNQRTARDWDDPDNLENFAQRVNDRISLVERIKFVFRDCLEGDSWMEDLQQDRTYQLLSQGVSAEILIYAARSVADSGLLADEREPQAIACRFACRELGFTEPKDIGTLQKYYRKGKELLKQARQSH